MAACIGHYQNWGGVGPFLRGAGMRAINPAEEADGDVLCRRGELGGADRERDGFDRGAVADAGAAGVGGGGAKRWPAMAVW